MIYHLNNKKIHNHQNLKQYIEEHWATGDNRRCITEAATKKQKHRVEGIKVTASETRLKLRKHDAQRALSESAHTVLTPRCSATVWSKLTFH